MRSISLKNYGYIDVQMPDSLLKNLRHECDTAKLKNPQMQDDIVNKKYIPSHYYLEDNKKDFMNFVESVFVAYNDCFPNLGMIKAMTNDLPYCHDRPWINYQKQGEFLPNHIHNGIFSYVTFIKIPKECKFEFTFTNIIGNLDFHEIKLTSKDEGKFIFFPAKLPHAAYPFNGSDEERISIAGNILFNSGHKK